MLLIFPLRIKCCPNKKYHRGKIEKSPIQSGIVNHPVVELIPLKKKVAIAETIEDTKPNADGLSTVSKKIIFDLKIMSNKTCTKTALNTLAIRILVGASL